jgi:hypothetical protein
VPEQTKEDAVRENRISDKIIAGTDLRISQSSSIEF